MTVRLETRTLGYTPRAPFIPFHERRQRWACLVCHRRAGKTVACVADLIDAALRCKKPNPRFAYVAPFYAQAKDVAWTYVRTMVADIPGATINESELRVDLPNGGRVRLYGADNYDRMRGIFLDGIVLDEFADMHPGVWGEVIRPALSDRQGWATFIGTPKGRNSFHEIYEGATKSPEWFDMMLRADDSGIIAEKELDDARGTMTPEQFAQEYLCSFEAAIMGAYYGKEMAQAEREGRIREVPYDPALPVHTAWDLGLNDATAIWFWQVAGPEIHVIGFYENHGQQLPHYASIVHSKGYKYAEHWFPPDVRATFLGMERSRVETLLSLGITPRILGEQKVMDGINALRVIFPRLYLDRACGNGLEALRQYRAAYDDKQRAFKDHPLHDWASNPADAARYMAVAYRELRPEVKPAPKPPQGITDTTWDQLMKARPAREERV